MALVGVELETLVSEPDALTTRPPAKYILILTEDFEKYVQDIVYRISISHSDYSIATEHKHCIRS